MDNRKKNLIYSAILIIFFVAVWAYRRYEGPGSAAQEKKIEFVGNTMGTSYSVKYLDGQGRNFQQEIDSVLGVFNQSLSTYIQDSEISRFNRDGILRYELPYLYPVLKRSKEIYEKTEGAFDPTVGPLVNAWGFGPENSRVPAKEVVDSLRQLVNYDSVYFDSVSACKMMKGMKLDFSAIAKGYGVDVVAQYLMAREVENIFVEIGGEIYCHGLNERGEPWRVGVNFPSYDEGEQRVVQAVVPLYDRAIATSGNYRNYYEVDGKKYAHTIDPVSGYPVQHSVLSASVFAPDCMTADAYATAFMVLGLEKAILIDEREKDIEIYLIYSDENKKLKTYASPGVANKIQVRKVN